MATTLSAGVAAFLMGQALFRMVLHLGGVRVHLAAALVALGGIWLGETVSGAAQLGFVAVIVLVSAAALQRIATRSGLGDGETGV